MDISGQISYNERLEQLIAQEAEKALCFSWLHNHAEALYSKRSTLIALPVIVLSTLAGTASIGSSSLFGGSSYATVGIGLVSIAVGILNTVGQYFSWTTRSEGHRIGYISYAKLHRFVSIELSLPRSERMQAADLLKVVREAVDRLAEVGPPLPELSIAAFKARFEKYSDVCKPEIANGLSKVTIYSGEKVVTNPLRDIEAKLTAERPRTPVGVLVDS